MGVLKNVSVYSHLCHYKRKAFCYQYILPNSIMFLIFSLLNSSSFGNLMLLRSYFPSFFFFFFAFSWRLKSCEVFSFTDSSQETGVRLFPHGIKLFWDSLLLVSSLFFFFLLTSVQGLSVTFAVDLCSLSFYSIFLSRRAFYTFKCGL